MEASEYPDVEPDHVVDPAETDDYSVLVHLAEHVGGLPVVAGNSISLMTDTDMVIDRLIADIDAARHHVHLLFYIFRDDAVGRRVAEALARAAAARRGVPGAGRRGRLAAALPPRGPWLRQQGVRILPVLPANLWRLPFTRLDLRNHRKLAVIDGRWPSPARKTSSRPATATSGRASGTTSWPASPARRSANASDLSGRLVLRVGRVAGGRGPCSRPPGRRPDRRPGGSHGPDEPTELFQDLIVRAIFLARRRVVITSPYFIPNEAMLLALRLAALRGVQVDLVIPRRCDHPVVEAAGSFYCDYLMRYGVRVFLFREGMLHAKTLTVDDELAMFGSANYDIRSFDLNFELNLFVHAAEAVEEMRRLQQGYLDRSRRATADDCPPTRGRPAER